MEANGPDAAGLENLPDIDRGHRVDTQRNGYGYACACLLVETDATEKRITRVISGKQLSLTKCKADTSLPKP